MGLNITIPRHGTYPKPDRPEMSRFEPSTISKNEDQNKATSPSFAIKNGEDGKDGKKPMEFVADPGHGSGCGHCVSQSARWVPKEQAAAFKQTRNKEILDKVWKHELAHASAGKHLAGAPKVTQHSDGSASGEVPIAIPPVDKTNPDKAMTDADIIVASAMAPDDPSSQDYAVAAQGHALRGEAQQAKFQLQSQPGNSSQQGNNIDQQKSAKVQNSFKQNQPVEGGNAGKQENMATGYSGLFCLPMLIM